MIKILPDERYEELREIFERDGCELPDPNTSNILFCEDEFGKIISFIVVESLLRVGQIYNSSEDKTIPRKLINYLLDRIPKNASVVVIASDERYESLCAKLEMTHLPGKLFRRDF